MKYHKLEVEQFQFLHVICENEQLFWCFMKVLALLSADGVKYCFQKCYYSYPFLLHFILVLSFFSDKAKFMFHEIFYEKWTHLCLNNFRLDGENGKIMVNNGSIFGENLNAEKV